MARDAKSTYYDAGGIETILIIKAKLTAEEYLGFLKGTAIRYLCRAPFKHPNQERDMEKVANYSKWASEQAAEMEAERSKLLDSVAFNQIDIHNTITEIMSEEGLGMPTSEELREIVENTGKEILATIDRCVHAPPASETPAEEHSTVGDIYASKFEPAGEVEVKFEHPLRRASQDAQDKWDGIGERN